MASGMYDQHREKPTASRSWPEVQPVPRPLPRTYIYSTPVARISVPSNVARRAPECFSPTAVS